jgi:ATP adenylyltransferase
MRGRLFIPNKLNYCQGDRPKVDCILCSVLKKDPVVENLMVWETRQIAVALNLYPYNPGHLMVFPKKHVEDYEMLSPSLAAEIHKAAQKCLGILKAEYKPAGFNMGWNLGKQSGASIAHLHMHIVPRYQSEAGFMDLIGDTKIIVEHPRLTRDRLIRAFNKK